PFPPALGNAGGGRRRVEKLLRVGAFGDAKDALAHPLDDALGDEATRAVEDVVYLVVVRVGVALHAEKLGVGLPDRDGDVVERKRWGEGAGGGQEDQPVPTGA